MTDLCKPSHLRVGPPLRENDHWRIACPSGDSIGKTALANHSLQFVLQCFVHGPTDGNYRRQFIVDDCTCFVEIIDTAGQEEYAMLRDQWIQEGQGFVLMYSITSRDSFDAVRASRQSVQRMQGENPIMMLVGTKCDKSFERVVSMEEGGVLAKELDCEFLETSVKTGQNVERVMTNLFQSL
ncbi:ras protein [Mycena maculata]|uniref:Ras protein n=1 Tax=Mycena maculata TaxID=230809 RepID=A0AAD7IT36_9AGAR|nr:ras protein [Mycena maculata]